VHYFKVSDDKTVPIGNNPAMNDDRRWLSEVTGYKMEIFCCDVLFHLLFETIHF
jgi:hypothetical protein